MTPVEVSAVALNPDLPIWGWKIAVYLFLGGLVAGLMILTGHFARRPGTEQVWWAPLAAPAFLAVGVLALFLDLEHKLHLYRFYTSFRIASPMSWGAWILLAVFPVSVAFALGCLGLAMPFRRQVAPLNMGLGVALGVYTGILLGALGARPLWNTPLLAPLFLVSGLSSAAALLALAAPSRASRHRFCSLDLKLIGLEAALLALMLIGLATGGEAQRAAARLFFGGGFTAQFWIFVVFVGMVLPAGLEWLERRGLAQSTLLPPLMVLAGGFALRAVLLLAGQASGWGIL